MSNVFVISAPSGAGKSSLVKELCKLDKNIKVSISHTTRDKRINEQDGVEYFFVTLDVFKGMLSSNKFIEHAKVYNNYYGTSIDTIERFKKNKIDAILEIDWQGAMQIKSIIPSAILIYIMPPNIIELEKRLRARATDKEDVIAYRLSLAQDDMSHAHLFDYTVINDNFDTALQQLYSIIMLHR